MKFDFIVDGTPVAKGRPRVCKNGHVYTPQKTVDYETHIQVAFMDACARANISPYFPLSEPVAVEIICYFDKPKKPKNDRYHITKPDADNLAKCYCDSLNKIAWLDDSCVFELKITKLYCGKIANNTPKAYISISTII